jgi:hypothetical protein
MSGHDSLVSTRLAFGAAGLAATAYGTLSLAGVGAENFLSALPWLLGGVVLHDALLAPLVVLVGVATAARVPDWARAAAAGALVVLGPVTLAALPAIGRFGARPDNPTLLDRPYAAGWAAVAALVLMVAGIAALVGRQRGGAHRG